MHNILFSAFMGKWSQPHGHKPWGCSNNDEQPNIKVNSIVDLTTFNRYLTLWRSNLGNPTMKHQPSERKGTHVRTSNGCLCLESFTPSRIIAHILPLAIYKKWFQSQNNRKWRTLSLVSLLDTFVFSKNHRSPMRILL